ncbi:MAG: protein kinase domain-containing protein [Calditrichia bacterium]
MVESLLHGKLIENYRILSVLGTGGMGTVFRAFDEELRRDVALKMMNPRFTENESFVQQFRKEGISQARLKHPNIVDVHALRETKFGLFIVMEFIDGITLAESIKQEGAMPWKQALPLFIHIIKGLSHAHQKGVIHRDIKPGNIMMTRGGNVKVSDFGIATISQDPRITKTTLTGGTLAYASPEQLKSLKLADERSDVYSVGMTFYEALAGSLPFDENQTVQAVRNQIIAGKLPSPRRINSQIPADLTKIVMKAIHKNPEKRYQNLNEMQTDLRTIQQLYFLTEDTELTSSPSPKRTRSRSFSKRLLMTLFLSAMIFAGYSMDFHTMLMNWSRSAASEDSLISIASTPENSFIYFDEKVVGITPIWRRKFPVGKQVSVKISKTGFRSLDTTITLAKGSNREFSFALAREDQNDARAVPRAEQTEVVRSLPEASVSKYGAIQINSTPSGAAIWLNGKILENQKTPTVIRKLPFGNHEIVLRRSGFKDYSENVLVEEGYATEHTAKLVARKGQLSVLVLPYGSVFINGRLKKENTHLAYNTELPGGLYTIRATHPMFGVWEKRIRISADKHVELSIDFNRVFDVRITAFDKENKPVMAEIYIDGKATGYTTPKKIQLRLGRHSFEVQKDGYRLAGGAQVVDLEEEMSKPLRLQLESD